jgi:hypothetical protein
MQKLIEMSSEGGGCKLLVAELAFAVFEGMVFRIAIFCAGVLVFGAWCVRGFSHHV